MTPPTTAPNLPHETTAIHTRIFKCALEIDDCRAFWAHAATPADAASPSALKTAFDRYWFGARSLAAVDTLLTNMRARFAAYPAALAALHRWPHMDPDTRRVICHWHLQLADPLYRAFTGPYLTGRRASLRPTVTRDLVVAWVTQNGPARWTLPTRIQCASKLLSAAHSAGLVAATRDPRPLALPRVPDAALAYLMYLLRETTFAGTLLDNPYAASVGLDPAGLEDRLRPLPGLAFKRQGDLIEFGWRHADLAAWAAANLTPPPTSPHHAESTA